MRGVGRIVEAPEPGFYVGTGPRQFSARPVQAAEVGDIEARMSLVVYGIPSCGTVKKARAWLDAAGVAYTFVDFRATPPAASQVDAWMAAFGARALRNTSGGSYRALGPEKDGWTDAQWRDAFLRDPMLIKRPVVERDGRPVVVGWNLPDDELRRRLG